MAKEPWKKCKCGIVVDPDEEHCPLCGSGNAPELKLVELDEDEVKALAKKRKVWTKHPARWWSQ
jgi:RNA polymerase subunit RPABC4/transcription elongation factor Spt4